MARLDRVASNDPRLNGHPAKSRGIALVLVLWVVTLLTVIAVAMTATQRTETALADNQISAARFRALSDAAIAYMVLSFVMPPPEQENEEDMPWIPNGAPQQWRFEGQDLTIEVTNEASRINLNQAPPELLAALLIALEVPEEDAQSIADAISDWRDEDDLKLLNGAEDGDYSDAGRDLGAKDEPFAAVEELQQVLGVTRGIYRLIAPELTVDTEDGQLVEEFASPAVLAAIQGVPLEEAQLQVEQRDSPILPGGQGPRVVNRGGPLYRVRVTENVGQRPARSMEALVEIVAGQQPPYQIRWRRFGLVGQRPSAASPHSNTAR